MKNESGLGRTLIGTACNARSEEKWDEKQSDTALERYEKDGQKGPFAV